MKLFEYVLDAVSARVKVSIAWRRVGKALPALLEFHDELTAFYRSSSDMRAEDKDREFRGRMNSWPCYRVPELLTKLYKVPDCDTSLGLIRIKLQSLNDFRIFVLEQDDDFERTLPLMLECIETIQYEYNKVDHDPRPSPAA